MIVLRFRFLYLIGCCYRLKTSFFFIWTLADGACVIAGLGFNGYDGNGTPLWYVVVLCKLD